MSRFNRIARMEAEVIWEAGHGPSWTLEQINGNLNSLKRGGERPPYRSLHQKVDEPSVGPFPDVTISIKHTIPAHFSSTPSREQVAVRLQIKLGTSSVCRLRWSEKGLRHKIYLHKILQNGDCHRFVLSLPCGIHLHSQPSKDVKLTCFIKEAPGRGWMRQRGFFSLRILAPPVWLFLRKPLEQHMRAPL